MTHDHFTIYVDYGRAVKASGVFRKALASFTPDTFTDPKYYPPEGTDGELVLRYFIFMVAIDHRTSRYEDFEGFVDGEFYHGADLLYRLGSRKFEENPDFFSPEHMSRIGVDEVREWLKVKGKEGKERTIWDPEVRAVILRDLGLKLLRLYGGRVRNLIASSRNRLKWVGEGLIERMRVFKAYSDPVEKKAYLFVKFISRRRLFTYLDPENSEVPVDNHLARIALRMRLVLPDEYILQKVRLRQPFTWKEDIGLRYAVRRAYKLVAKGAGTDPLILDDFLWMFGRACCTREKPLCVSGCSGKCRMYSLCSDGCPFREFCDWMSTPEEIIEHIYQDTYYY